MTPLVKRFRDIAIILAVIAGIAFLMILSGNSLTSKMSLMRAYSVWFGVVTRPDIVVTTLLSIAVTMGWAAYQAVPRR